MRAMITPSALNRCAACGGELRLKGVRSAAFAPHLLEQVLACVQCGDELAALVEQDRYSGLPAPKSGAPTFLRRGF